MSNLTWWCDMQQEKIPKGWDMWDPVASLNWVTISWETKELTCKLRSDGQEEES